MNKSAVHQITDAIGTAWFTHAFGVSGHAVRSCRTNGWFPGSWFGPLKAKCDDMKILCPLDAFKWKRPADQHGVCEKISQASAVLSGGEIPTEEQA